MDRAAVVQKVAAVKAAINRVTTRSDATRKKILESEWLLHEDLCH